MMAIQRAGNEVAWRRVERPQITSADQIEIRVERVGICRTDLYAARGLLPCKEPGILGHELSGVVVQTGANIDDMPQGPRVTASPFLPHFRHLNAQMIGVHRDGAFAEFIVLPRRVVFAVPQDLGFEKAAYVEPVAASLAPLQAPIARDQRGLIYGEGRIAELTARVLRCHGFDGVETCPAGANLDQASFDFIVETQATAASLSSIIDALKPGGLLVLKSRPNTSVAINTHSIVRREIRLHGVHYGSFEAAIDLLASGQLAVDDLLGRTTSMADFAPLFEELWEDESKKRFLAPPGVI